MDNFQKEKENSIQEKEDNIQEKENNIQEKEDNIRPPDKVIKERLIEDNRCEFQKQMDKALYNSLQEFKKQDEMNMSYEEELIKIYNEECTRRKNVFREFLLNINRISKFDAKVKEIYEIIEPIIDSYCNQIVQFCSFDEDTYNKIFNILKTIRNNQIAFDTLKTIIIKD